MGPAQASPGIMQTASRFKDGLPTDTRVNIAYYLQGTPQDLCAVRKKAEQQSSDCLLLHWCLHVRAASSTAALQADDTLQPLGNGKTFCRVTEQ